MIPGQSNIVKFKDWVVFIVARQKVNVPIYYVVELICADVKMDDPDLEYFAFGINLN